MAPVFRKPTIEQLDEFLRPGMQALIDGSKYVDEKLVEIFEELRPDAIVEDNVVAPGDRGVGEALGADRVVQPARAEGPGATSRVLRVPRRRHPGWDEFRAEHRRTHLPMWEDFDEFVRTRSAGASGARVHPRIGIPQPLRLSNRSRLRALGAAGTDLASLECSVRETEAEWDVPEQLAAGLGDSSTSASGAWARPTSSCCSGSSTSSPPRRTG